MRGFVLGHRLQLIQDELFLQVCSAFVSTEILKFDPSISQSSEPSLAGASGSAVA